MKRLLVSIQLVTFVFLFTNAQNDFFLNDWQEKSIKFSESTPVDKPTTNSTTTITVNTKDTIKRVSKYLFGNNAVSYCSDFTKDEGLIEDITNLAPNVIRWPGGNQTHEYFWDVADNERPDDIPDNINIWTGITDAEWRMSNASYYKLLEQTNSTGIICVNTGYARYGTSEDPVGKAAHYAAEWVRFDNGRTKFWEVGNEDYGNWVAGYEIDPSLNQDGQPAIVNGTIYGNHAKVFIDSMRTAAAEIGHEIKIGVVAFEGEESWTDVMTNWNEEMMPLVGNDADYYIVHSYFTPYEEDSDIETVFESAHTIPFELIDVLEDDTEEANVPMLPVAMTEWNIFAEGSMQQISYVNGMHCALTMGEFIMNGYGLACKWNFANGWWGDGNDHGMFAYGSTPGMEKFAPHPLFYYMYYFQKIFGDRMVGSNVSGNENVVAYASTFCQEDCGIVLINKSKNDEVIEIELNNFYPGNNYFYYTLTGGEDADNFSRKLFINESGPTSEAGGPDNYATLKPYSSKIEGGIKINLPALATVFMVVEDVPPVLFETAKVDSNASIIDVKFNSNVIVPMDAKGFVVKVNEVDTIAIKNIELHSTDSSVAIFTLEKSLTVNDKITISYNEGNIISPDSAPLIEFTNKIVENLLPGSSPRLIEASSSFDGLNIELSYNKFMQVTSSALNELELKVTFENESSYTLSNIAIDDTVKNKVIITPNKPLFAEYKLQLSYNGVSMLSVDGGFAEKFDTILINNHSPGLAPVVKSATVTNAGLTVSLEMSKTMNNANAFVDSFTLLVNGAALEISNIHTNGVFINITPAKMIKFNDTVKISYTGNSLTSLDRGIVAPFANIAVQNNLPEPVITSIPGIVDCELFVTNNGMQLETCNDVGGGQNFGYIDPGDYADYIISIVEAGTYTVSVRTASDQNGGKIALQLPETNTPTLDTIDLPGTGGWQNWLTAYGTVELPAGEYILRLLAPTSGYNLNWVGFEKGEAMPEVQITEAMTNADGTSIIITFDTKLKAPSQAETLNYTVMVDDNEIEVNGYAVQNNKLTLNLSEAINQSTSSITVSYTPGSLQGNNNAPVAAFTDYPVNNLVSIRTNKANANFSVFPNPISNEFSVVSKDQIFKTLKITDLSGKIVYNKKLNNMNKTINVNIDLTSGTYVLTLENKTNIAKKLIVVD